MLSHGVGRDRRHASESDYEDALGAPCVAGGSIGRPQAKRQGQGRLPQVKSLVRLPQVKVNWTSLSLSLGCASAPRPRARDRSGSRQHKIFILPLNNTAPRAAPGFVNLYVLLAVTSHNATRPCPSVKRQERCGARTG